MDHDDPLQESSGDDTGTGSEDASEEEQSWISWFCSIRGNEFFVEVEEEYIHDEFNLTGLSQEVPYFDYALDTILDVDSPNADLLTEEQQETVDAAAELLYGLIHARYIITSKGMNAMYDKYSDAHFGRCARVYCEGQAMLPVGQSDLPRKSTVALYCPRCNDIYYPKSSRHSNIDGAYFGTTFAHLFLMTFPTSVPPPPALVYVPRVFGFRVRRELLSADAAASSGGSGAAAAAGEVASLAAGIVGVRAVGPAGAVPTEARPAGGTRMGRTREFATVLAPEAAAARRRAGQDDFMDEDEEDAPTPAAAPGRVVGPPTAGVMMAGWGGSPVAAGAPAVDRRVAGEERNEEEEADNPGDEAGPESAGRRHDAAGLRDRAIVEALERLTLTAGSHGVPAGKRGGLPDGVRTGTQPVGASDDDEDENEQNGVAPAAAARTGGRPPHRR